MCVRAPPCHRVHRCLGGNLKSQTKSEQVPTTDDCGFVMTGLTFIANPNCSPGAAELDLGAPGSAQE